MLRKLDPTLKSLLGEKHLWEWGGEDSFKVAGNIGHIFGSVEWKKEKERTSGMNRVKRCYQPALQEAGVILPCLQGKTACGHLVCHRQNWDKTSFHLTFCIRALQRHRTNKIYDLSIYLISIALLFYIFVSVSIIALSHIQIYLYLFVYLQRKRERNLL